MNSTVIVKSARKNIYMYDFLKKELKPCHPIVYYCYLLDRKCQLNTDNLKNNIEIEYEKNHYSMQDIKYYLDKYLHYKKLGYFSSFNKQDFIQYKSNDVIESISNVKNLVFEVTDACNLKCKYCAYGEFYNDYDERKNRMMSFTTVKTVLNYLLPYWVSKANKSSLQIISIGFYGGEPLLNFNLIKKTVEYCNRLDLQTRQFQYTMTTNATLIDKYISFLVENNFHLTISIDGSEFNHSYRIYHNKKDSFQKVFSNIKMIQEDYPEYFKKYVSFNSVLHNRNSVEEIHNFIYKEFQKIPEIHSVNDSGIKKEKKEEFNKMFVSYKDSMDYQKKELVIERFTSDPKIFNLCKFLLWYGNNQYFDYESFLYGSDICKKTKTGTCFPFSRKMYVTVNNKILACERINQKYILGNVMNDRVCIDPEMIAKKYNTYYSKMKTQCQNCYMINGCNQCIFQIDNLEESPVCYGFKNERQICEYIKEYLDLLEDNCINFERLIKDVYFS